MKIGIFLGYGPQVKLGKEGLGRYLGGLMKGFQASGHQITIACPKWLLETLNDLMDAFAIDKQKIRWIVPGSDPALWRIYSFLTRPKGKHGFFQKIKDAVWNGELHLAERLAQTQGTAVFFALALLAVPAVLLAVLLLPIIALALLLRKGWTRGYAFAKKLYFKWDNHQYNQKLAKQEKGQRTRDLPLHLFLLMNDAVNKRLVDRINRSQEIEAWFVPAVFWPQVNRIKGTVIINAPDLVSQEFPQGFAGVYNADNAIGNCRRTLEEGKYFITYSEYLREQLLIQQYGKKSEYTVAIPHINNDMRPYIAVDPTLSSQLHARKDLSRAFADTVLRRTLSLPCGYGYTEGIRWNVMHYIFYPSQPRPSKNMLTLVKAYEYLLRKKFITQKLFLTCNYTANAMLRSYIEEHQLQNDIICFYNVPTQTLAALYCLADLVVAPTLYEGGFPFIFGEGMSVGTPAIMSDIPQVREVLEPAGLACAMFDPYDWHRMAQAIEYWLPRTEELLAREQPLYEKLAQRTPAVVADEYVQAFRRFMACETGGEGADKNDGHE